MRHPNRNHGRLRGFTLVELLIVMLIILLVSAAALPTVLPALNHREVSEAARILQAGLVSARDTAINNNAPAGIRLLPDPVFNGINPTTGQLDPTRVLASNRFVPIQLPPDYSEGFLRANQFYVAGSFTQDPTTSYPYWFGNSGGTAYYPVLTQALLYVEESVYEPTSGLPHPPTSWYWNIRIGDKLQINNTGILYTVVGPMNIPNPELFVNIGPPGTTSFLQRTGPGGTIANPELLFLVNGQDDNNDGFVDNGWDGVDNDGDGLVDQMTSAGNYMGEWIDNNRKPIEAEQWPNSASTFSIATRDFPYRIIRRPSVVPGARETLLPSSVVVDLTTWEPTAFGGAYVQERSRLPISQLPLNQATGLTDLNLPPTGFVDILVQPNGQVVPTTIYSSPSSFGMSSAFYHFWLAERSDLFDPVAQANVPYLLPMVPDPLSGYPNSHDQFPTRALSGERRLLTLYTRTGQMVVNDVQTFNALNPSYPFLSAQQGIRGDTR
jgi:prepilin-type N-terminal cleavage/methylation domain-containing protein